MKRTAERLTLQSGPQTLQTIADLIGARLQGDPDCLISGIASLDSAKAGEVSFLSNRQYRKFLLTTKATAVIVGAEDAEGCPVHALISDNPRLSLAKVAKLFEKEPVVNKGIHATALMGEGSQVASTASIGAYCVIGENVTIGENAVINASCVIGNDCVIGAYTVLKHRVTLYDQVKIGEYCLIHSGAVIGSDGFGFANQGADWVKMPHLGGVVIGNHVEIGANTTIDRGFLEDTTLGNGVIVDNLVQIGHNVIIGARTAIAGCVGIAGSTTIGESCLIGGASSIAGHINITDRVHLTGTSAVSHSLNSPGVYSSGFPARPVHQWRKNAMRFFFLDNMSKRLRALEKKVSSGEPILEEDDE